MPDKPTKRVKVASASLSQVVYDYAANVGNIKRAIDTAAAEGADILATEELSLVGYPADDYHQWNKDNDNVWTCLADIARYAADKDPNLVVTVGAPWHYADKSKPANDPEYNINNRPFNVHAVLTGGRVVAMLAKSILADGPAEYEPRQFNHWPLAKGTITVALPDGSHIPFGKPLIHLADGEAVISLTNEICAEAWPGVYYDLTVNMREQIEARTIVALAKDNDLSIILNSSASRPEPCINKEKIRIEGLCLTGSSHCGLYVYTNYLGSASAIYAAEGGQIFAQNGALAHHGQRYTFKAMSYSSLAADVPVAMRGKPDAVVGHVFKNHAFGKTGGESAFDQAYAEGKLSSEELAYEEYLRSASLWLRDYLAKPAFAQGYVISLSGGKDSAYGALAVSTMIDLDIAENGVDGFLARFKHLRIRDAALKVFKEKGEAPAKKFIKSQMLTCVYLPTDISSSRTLNAARFLIEGGALPDGSQVEGIGGKLIVAPVERVFEEMLAASTGLDLDALAAAHAEKILGQRHAALLNDERTAARAALLQKIMDYVNAAPGQKPPLPDFVMAACVHPLPSWANKDDDLNLQNLQARSRQPLPWTIASYEGKIPLTTSNESEAALGYTTAGGDLHMGGANPIGGIPKHAITHTLLYLEKRGLAGLKPLPSLYWINRETPTAELRRLQKGEVEQTDELDLGFTYRQSQFIESMLIAQRLTPSETLSAMRESGLFPHDLSAMRDILIRFARRWEAAQFKRIMAPLSPHVGNNVDPHQSVRTTVLGDHFRTGCAIMTLEILRELAGGEDGFKKKHNMSFKEAIEKALLNSEYKKTLVSFSINDLLNQQRKAMESG